jgi:hypothetical protein
MRVSTVSMRLPFLLVLGLLVFIGCEQRQPLNRSMAAAIADHYQRYQNVNWGDPIESMAPGEPDQHGRTWWQFRYQSGPDGARRMILVDNDSGWSRFPSDDYLERVPPQARPSATNPLQVVEGSWILRLAPPRQVNDDERVKLEREAIRLNTLAGQTGLVPIFSLRRHSDGQAELIYGWQADRGIARDERVLDWVNRRTGYVDAAWENLLAQ